ncbi:MAG: metallophosphoesterase, partial [Chloroflexota bacterium]
MFKKYPRFIFILAAVLVLITAAGLTVQSSSAHGAAAAGTASATPAAATSLPKPTPTNFKLTILHTNDVHAHHAPNADGDGGEALASSVINQVRAKTPNTVLLSAGDTFIGTLFYTQHHGLDSAELMNKMKYDAMTLGNHEFDEGDGNLALFIKKLTFPVVAANVNFEKSSTLSKIAPYVILTKGGEKIGVIGLANPETPTISRPGSDLVFNTDSLSVTQKTVDELTKLGVNKIIVLSHMGYSADQELAKAVKGVDVIVGGHTHTLLANFDNRAAGPYPAKVENPDGKTVLVVQAGEYLAYLGKLDVEFDSNGDVVTSKGDTIFLSHYITPDPAVSAIVTRLYSLVTMALT